MLKEYQYREIYILILTPKLTKDFGYLYIEDLYTDDELDKIWKETKFLDYFLDQPEPFTKRITSSAMNELEFGKEPKFLGSGCFLDHIYAERKVSPILTFNRKLYTEEVGKAFYNHPANERIDQCDLDWTLLNRYESGAYYKPHYDLSVFSALTFLVENFEDTTGGDLIFSDYDITFPPITNTAILFPSWVNHTVTQVKGDKESSRYSIAQFLSFKV